MPNENFQSLQQISANHRRVVSIRMRLLEESCFRLLELFRGVDSIFVSRHAFHRLFTDRRVTRCAHRHTTPESATDSVVQF